MGGRHLNDITGKRFGMLTAVRPTDQRLHRTVVWEWVCDCGNITFVSLSNLKSGSTRSCGCLRKESAIQRGAKKIKDLTGQRFGRLVVIGRAEEKYDRAVIWECLCDCGGSVFTTGNSLKRGNTQSCGCLRKETLAENGKMRTKDLTGQRFGKLVALKLTEKREHGFCVWRCVCDCGNTAYVKSSSLTGGNTKSCGCLRKKPESIKYVKEGSVDTVNAEGKAVARERKDKV